MTAARCLTEEVEAPRIIVMWNYSLQMCCQAVASENQSGGLLNLADRVTTALTTLGNTSGSSGGPGGKAQTQGLFIPGSRPKGKFSGIQYGKHLGHRDATPVARLALDCSGMRVTFFTTQLCLT